MPRFKYRAMDKKGSVTEGFLTAPNLASLTEVLRGQGQMLLSGVVAPEKPAVAPGAPAPAAAAAPMMKVVKTNKRLTEAEIITFNNQLQLMVRSSVPIVETLGILAAQQTNRTFAAILQSIADAVTGGNSLTAAFGQYPKVFDRVYLSLLEAGEKSGTLPHMLERISEHLAFKASIRARAKSAMIYPAVVMGTAFVVVLGLIVFVLPNFAEVFEQFDAELPPVTRFLLFLSHTLRHYWFAYIGAAGMIGWSFWSWLKDENHGLAVETIMLNTPVVGPLMKAIILARISRTLGELLKAGVIIIKALELTEATAGDVVFARMIAETRRVVTGGMAVSVGFTHCDHMPNMVPCILAGAEKAGRLPEALAFLATFYETEIDATLKDFFAVLEPIFVVFLGVTIGGIALAFLVPIFKLGGIVQ